jgi:hypothetical protein
MSNVRQMASTEDLSAKWLEYKRNTRLATLWLVLGLPAVVALSILAKLVIGEASIAVLLVLTVTWALLWAVLCVRVTRFRCPRCRQLYFAHTQLYYGAGRSCSHCKLALYEGLQQSAGRAA